MRYLLLIAELNLNMRFYFIFNIFLYFLSLYFISFAEAKDIKKEQRNAGNWIAYIEKKGNKKICYTYSNPVKIRLYQEERGIPYVNINYLDKKRFTITVYVGYEIATNYPVSINIDNKKIALKNISQNYAITYDSSQDTYLINLFVKSMSDHFVIKSYKDKDNLAIDYYSLSGLKEALKYLENKCL